MWWVMLPAGLWTSVILGREKFKLNKPKLKRRGLLKLKGIFSSYNGRVRWFMAVDLNVYGVEVKIYIDLCHHSSEYISWSKSIVVCILVKYTYSVHPPHEFLSLFLSIHVPNIVQSCYCSLGTQHKYQASTPYFDAPDRHWFRIPRIPHSKQIAIQSYVIHQQHRARYMPPVTCGLLYSTPETMCIECPEPCLACGSFVKIIHNEMLPWSLQSMHWFSSTTTQIQQPAHTITAMSRHAAR